MDVKTNNQPRDVLRWHELSAKEQAEFDYRDTVEKQDEGSFVRYRGWVYDLSEFMRVDGEAFPSHRPHVKWDGVQSDTYFSGVLVRYADEYGDTVIMGRYYS